MMDIRPIEVARGLYFYAGYPFSEPDTVTKNIETKSDVY